MKKRILLLALLLCLVLAFDAGAYTAAIGAEFALKLGEGLPSSALLSARLPTFPAILGLGLTIPAGGGDASMALLADWWLSQGKLVDFFNYYVGVGAFLGLSEGLTLGLRVPVGANFYPIKPLELFIEAAPAFTLLAPSGIRIPALGVQAGFGFRFWF